MSFELPPVVKLAERLLLEIEQAARRFARFHKYTFGSELRTRAFSVASLAHKSWVDREHKEQWLQKLVFAIDDLKICLQLGKQIKAFASFAQFEVLARIANDIGKQVGGWYRQHKHPKSQNAGPGVASQRAQMEAI